MHGMWAVLALLSVAGLPICAAADARYNISQGQDVGVIVPSISGVARANFFHYASKVCCQSWVSLGWWRLHTSGLSSLQQLADTEQQGASRVPEQQSAAAGYHMNPHSTPRSPLSAICSRLRHMHQALQGHRLMAPPSHLVFQAYHCTECANSQITRVQSTDA